MPRIAAINFRSSTAAWSKKNTIKFFISAYHKIYELKPIFFLAKLERFQLMSEVFYFLYVIICYYHNCINCIRRATLNVMLYVSTIQWMKAKREVIQLPVPAAISFHGFRRKWYVKFYRTVLKFTNSSEKESSSSKIIPKRQR